MFVVYEQVWRTASKEKKVKNKITKCRKQLKKPLDWLSNPCNVNESGYTVEVIGPQTTRWQDIENETKRIITWINDKEEVNITLHTPHSPHTVLIFIDD